MKLHIDWSDNQTVYKTGFLLRYRLKKAVRAALRYENFTQDAMVSVTFTDNEGIREINKEHREIDAPTDVLSFPMMSEDGDCDINMGNEAIILGDIVISLERAREQAKELGHSYTREVAFLTVHSVLHLLGYDHVTSEEDERVMCDKQSAVLDSMGIKR